MKRYLLAMMVLATMGANAESNPFDLQKNLQKIDQDQDVLLSALKEMADKKEEIEEMQIPVEETVMPEASNVVQEPSVAEVSTEVKADRIEVAEEINSPSTDTSRVDAIREKLMAEEAKKNEVVLTEENQKNEESKKLEKQQIVLQKAEEERIEKVKAEQAKIEQERIEQAKREEERVAEIRTQRVEEEQAKLAAQKAEEERLEVAAYEAERLAKQQQEEKLALEAKAAEEMKQQAVEKAKHAVVDINITREALVAKQEADKAYSDAVREMDRED